METASSLIMRMMAAIVTIVGLLSLFPPALQAELPQAVEIPNAWDNEAGPELPILSLPWKDELADDADPQPRTAQPYKKLQLYTLGTHLLMPGMQASLLMTGYGCARVEMTIWKIDLLQAIQQGLHDASRRISEYAECRQSWEERIADPVAHFKQKITLPILPPGCYAVIAKDQEIQAITFILISDLAMLVKRDAETAIAWTTMRNGENCAGPVQLYLFQGKQLLHAAKTNSSGIWAARLAGKYSPMLVLAVAQDHYALANSVWYRYEHLAHRTYIYLDRYIYFPGQTIQAKLFLRQWDFEQRRYRWNRNALVQATIQDQDWKTLCARQLSGNALGTANVSYTLPIDAKPGKYTIRIYGDSPGDRDFEVLALPRAGNAELSLSSQPNSSETPVRTEREPRQKPQHRLSTDQEGVLRLKLAESVYQSGETMPIAFSSPRSVMPMLFTFYSPG